VVVAVAVVVAAASGACGSDQAAAPVDTAAVLAPSQPPAGTAPGTTAVPSPGSTAGPDDTAAAVPAPPESQPPPTGAPPTAAPTTTGRSFAGVPPGARVEVVADRLDAPWAVAFTPEGAVWVTERDRGEIIRVEGDGTRTAVARLPVDAGGEGGLLGLVASPDYAGDGLLYAYYTGPGDNRVVRFRPGEPTLTPVVTGIAKASIHDGGRLAFGPDGMLYIGTGDASVAARAQDPDSLNGKILRVAPDGSVPAGNPFPGSPVWSLGHRNVQGLAWDGAGRLYATEFGPDRDDELNLIRPGANYGWPDVTGQAGRAGFTDPLVVLQPPQSSPSGLTFVAAPGAWQGDLLWASLRGERMWRARLDGAGGVAGVEPLFERTFGRLRTVTSAPDGTLWALTNNTDGRGTPRPADDLLVRITPPA
jgi:glucose/arabinose dehydrogenase